MREAEIAERHSKYKKKKPFSKEVIMFSYAIVFALFLFTVITKNSIFLFLFVTAFSTIVNYHTNIQTIRFNPDPEVFSGLLLTKVLGFNYALIMLAIPTIIVDVYTARLDKDTFISTILAILICYVMSIVRGSFIWWALILVTVKFILGLILNALIDITPQEILFEHVLGFISNIIMLSAFGNFFLRLFT